MVDGITLDDFVCLAQCNAANAQLVRPPPLLQDENDEEEEQEVRTLVEETTASTITLTLTADELEVRDEKLLQRSKALLQQLQLQEDGLVAFRACVIEACRTDAREQVRFFCSETGAVFVSCIAFF